METGSDTRIEVCQRRMHVNDGKLFDCHRTGCELRNDRILAETSVVFRAFDETLRYCVESLLCVAKVQSKLKPGFKRY